MPPLTLSSLLSPHTSLHSSSNPDSLLPIAPLPNPLLIAGDGLPASAALNLSIGHLLTEREKERLRNLPGLVDEKDFRGVVENDTSKHSTLIITSSQQSFHNKVITENDTFLRDHGGDPVLVNKGLKRTEIRYCHSPESLLLLLTLLSYHSPSSNETLNSSQPPSNPFPNPNLNAQNSRNNNSHSKSASDHQPEMLKQRPTMIIAYDLLGMFMEKKNLVKRKEGDGNERERSPTKPSTVKPKPLQKADQISKPKGKEEEEDATTDTDTEEPPLPTTIWKPLDRSLTGEMVLSAEDLRAFGEEQEGEREWDGSVGGGRGVDGAGEQSEEVWVFKEGITVDDYLGLIVMLREAIEQFPALEAEVPIPTSTPTLSSNNSLSTPKTQLIILEPSLTNSQVLPLLPTPNANTNANSSADLNPNPNKLLQTPGQGVNSITSKQKAKGLNLGVMKGLGYILGEECVWEVLLDVDGDEDGNDDEDVDMGIEEEDGVKRYKVVKAMGVERGIVLSRFGVEEEKDGEGDDWKSKGRKFFWRE